MSFQFWSYDGFMLVEALFSHITWEELKSSSWTAFAKHMMHCECDAFDYVLSKYIKQEILLREWMYECVYKFYGIWKFQFKDGMY